MYIYVCICPSRWERTTCDGEGLPCSWGLPLTLTLTLTRWERTTCDGEGLLTLPLPLPLPLTLTLTLTRCDGPGRAVPALQGGGLVS